MRFRSPGFEYQSQLPQPPQNNNIFYQNRPFLPPYNNQYAFYRSPTGLYHPTMYSLTSSQANQPYSPLNRVTLDMDFEQLINSQDYYQSQDYSMGHGSAHENSEKENSMKAKGFWEAVINYFGKETDSTRGHDFTLEHCYNILKYHQRWLDIEIPAFYKNTKGRKKSKTSKTTSGSASGGFNLNNEAGEYEEEAQEHRPMGHDRAKAKKKSFASSCEESSSFVDLVADKYLGIKSTKWEKMQEQQDSYIQLKNRELDIQEAAHKEGVDLKIEKLEIQRRKKEMGQRHLIL
ncbi:gag-pol polyprotein [Tanacetum coccineum]